MRVAMIGTGYIGLVTGTCFAESGNDVACIDVDREKIEALRNGVVPIYEPGLGELVQRNQRSGRLTFTTDLGEGMEDREMVFVCVGTPPSESGAVDLRAVWAVVDGIRERAETCKIVIIKSTVPVGTNAKVGRRLNEGRLRHRTASNPEFLKEGCAVEDFMKPDRVVVGTHDGEVAEVLQELHAPYLRSGHPLLVMSPESAEMTKYAANCCLATKISFINEMANLCECLGADINDVRRGIGHDARIGFQFLHPGVGFGGSCFPKDVSATIAHCDEVGIPSRMMRAVHEVNEAQKNVLLEKLLAMLDGALAGRTVAVWGLAFKPRTDDVREAPSLVLIRQLLQAGAAVRVFDPEAMSNTRHVFADRITYCDRAYDAVEGADALAVVTEWQEFRNPDFRLLRRLMNRPIIADGRNLYDPAQMAELGFTYASVGRQTRAGSLAPGMLMATSGEAVDAAVTELSG
ncbi:MAG: UDP-glucose 6-dehydrogenase [Planctomycetes bacterium RBG_13_63_9]|nr:MAG: UDP-glucose 6-dehydrogenase [Planctomycetes bacterium RBG_13_63_9]